MERNQSSEERHFGVMKRRQSSRPNLNELSLLQEEQLKQFCKHPDLFEDLGFTNEDAKLLLEEHVEQFKNQSVIVEEEEREEEDTEVGDIEQVINKLLSERDDFSEDDEDDFYDSDEV